MNPRIIVFWLVPILISILTFKYLPGPYRWIFLLWALAFLIATISSRRTFIKLASFNFMAILFILAIAESYLSVQHDKSERGNRYKLENVYNSKTDPFLGWAEAPNTQRTARKIRIHDNTPVYEVTITMNENGLRLAHPYNQQANSKGESLLFFGGSFTFGEGVHDHQTMPYVIGTLTNGQFMEYNFGNCGYGPHHMLAAIEHGLVDSFVKVEPRFIIYQGIIDHVSRVSHRYRWENGPQYKLDNMGKVIYVGGQEMCHPSHENCVWKHVKQHLKKSALLNRFMFHRVTDKEIQLFLKVVEQSKTLLQARYPEAEFHVVFWDKPNNFVSEAIVQGLREKNVNLHLIHNVIPDYRKNRNRYHIANDGHPSVAAHNRIAQYVVMDILGKNVDSLSQARDNKV